MGSVIFELAVSSGSTLFVYRVLHYLYKYLVLVCRAERIKGATKKDLIHPCTVTDCISFSCRRKTVAVLDLWMVLGDRILIFPTSATLNNFSDFFPVCLTAREVPIWKGI